MSPVLEAPATEANQATAAQQENTAELRLPISVMEIMDTIPHRYPFLLVDRITAFEPGKFVRSYKNVTINEPFFQGHFPGLPVMPGVLQVEAMAQTGAFLMRHLLGKESGKIAVLTGLDNFRFRRIVKPGDQLIMEGELLRFRAPLGKARCKAFVDGQVVAEGDILFSMVDADQIQ
jgi:3-hydroxyacyl-[acyl-carrier-protein] dehydratase